MTVVKYNYSSRTKNTFSFVAPERASVSQLNKSTKTLPLIMAGTYPANVATLQQQVAALTEEIRYIHGNQTQFASDVDAKYANVRDLDVSWLVLCGESVGVWHGSESMCGRLSLVQKNAL